MGDATHPAIEAVEGQGRNFAPSKCPRMRPVRRCVPFGVLPASTPALLVVKRPAQKKLAKRMPVATPLASRLTQATAAMPLRSS